MFEDYPETLKVTDISSYLGVSSHTITNQIAKGNLKAYKIGKQYIVFKQDMIDYMNSHIVKKPD